MQLEIHCNEVMEEINLFHEIHYKCHVCGLKFEVPKR